MFISATHDISNAKRYKNILKFSLTSVSDKPKIVYFLLINVEMPLIVGILKFMSMISCSAELSMIFLIISGSGSTLFALYAERLKIQGPVVQSVVSLTSSLRGQLVKCFATL